MKSKKEIYESYRALLLSKERIIADYAQVEPLKNKLKERKQLKEDYKMVTAMIQFVEWVLGFENEKSSQSSQEDTSNSSNAM